MNAHNQDSFEKIIDKVLDNITDEVFFISQLRLVEDNKIDTSFLLKSGNINREFLKKTINYSAPYASFVHNGRLPGTMPPVEALENWTRRKLNLSVKEARRVSWAIAVNIKKRGIVPCPFLQESILKINNKVVRIEL